MLCAPQLVMKKSQSPSSPFVPSHELQKRIQ